MMWWGRSKRQVKIGVCGWGECGKDTFAEMLRDCSTLRYYAGTSKYAAGIVYERWGQHYYESAEECWEDRRNHRDDWVREILAHNSLDCTRLYKDCLKEQDILTGVRSLKEFRDCKEANLCDAWVWIERPGIKVDTTCIITEEDCDFTIHNNEGLEELQRKAQVLASLMGVSK